MPGMDNINWDQHKLTEKSVHGVPIPKEHREVLRRAVLGGHPMIARQTSKKHVQIYVKDDGLVLTSGTGGGGRGAENFEGDMRRAHRSVGKDFPKKNESMKQFQRRMEKQQGNNNGQE